MTPLAGIPGIHAEGVGSINVIPLNAFPAEDPSTITPPKLCLYPNTLPGYLICIIVKKHSIKYNSLYIADLFHSMSNLQRNILTYKIDSVFNWFFLPIGTYVLIWNTDLKLDFAQINSAIAAGLLLSVILELPSGALADIIGRKRTVVIGRITLFCAYLFFYIQHNFLGVIVFQLLYYVDNSFTSGAQSALLYDSLKEEGLEKKLYKKIEADTFLFCTLGMAIASISSGYLYKIDPFLPFGVMIPITFIGLLASLFYIEPKIDSEKYHIKDYLKQNIDGVRHIFRNSKVRWVSLFSIITMIITYVSVWYLYEPRITKPFDDPTLIAWLIGGTYLMRAIGTRFVDRFERIFRSKYSSIALILSMSVGSLFSFVRGGFGAVSSVYLRKFVDGYRLPIINNMQNEHIESKYRATSLSAVSLLVNLVLVPLGLLVGNSIDKLGVENTLGLVGIFGLLIGVPVSINMSRVLQEDS